MGLVFDPEEIGAKHLAVEIRRESVVLMDINRKYPCDIPVEERTESNQIHGVSEHIFAYQHGEIEISKEVLLELMHFLDDPKHRERVFGDYAKVGA